MGWTVKIHTIDVSQGDCSLIQIIDTENGESVTVLIDGGRKDQDEKIPEYLVDQDIDTIQLIVITHMDTDHYEGIQSLLLKDNYWYFCRTMLGVILEATLNALVSPQGSDYFSQIEEDQNLEVFRDLYTAVLTEFLERFLISTASLRRKKEGLVNGYLEELLTVMSDYFDFDDIIHELTEEKDKNEKNDSYVLLHLYRNKIFRWFTLPFWEEPFVRAGQFKNTVIIKNGNPCMANFLRILEGSGMTNSWKVKAEDNPYLEFYGVNRVIHTLGDGNSIGADILTESGVVTADIPVKLVLAAVNRMVDPSAGGIQVTGDASVKNCSSIALLLLFQDFLFYTGGDLPRDGEDAIVGRLLRQQYGALPRINCFGFKAGHHGSKTATGDGILSLGPKFAVISCGDNLSKYDRDFDHPSPETIVRLNDCTSLRVFFATACAHPIPHFNDKGVISGYTKAREIWLRNRVRLERVDNVYNHTGTMCCEIVSAGAEISTVTMYLYEGSASRCRYREYSIYDREERDYCENRLQGSGSFVLVPGLMELESVEWQLEDGINRFRTDMRIGEIPLELECSHLKMQKRYEGTLIVKEQQELTLSDLAVWLERLFPALGAVGKFFEKTGLSCLGFTGLSISVDADTKKLRSMYVFGKVHLGEVDFIVMLGLPDFTVHGALAEDQKPSLKEWIGRTGVSESSLSFLGEIQLVNLGFWADCSRKSFAFEMELCSSVLRENAGFGFESLKILSELSESGGIKVYADAGFFIGNVYFQLAGMYDRGNLALEGEFLELENEFALSLSQLPVVGEYLPEGMEVQVSSLRFGYESGFYLEVCLQVLGEEVCFRLMKEQSADTIKAAETADVLNLGKRIALQKRLGPVELQVVWITLTEEAFLITPELTIQMGGFEVALTDASLGIDLKTKSPVLRLDGIGMSYEAAQFAIAAEFRKSLAQQMAYQYDGVIRVKAGNWQFLGVGSYGKTAEGILSAYLLADVSMRLMIQPSFVLTDIIGGAGLHRELRTPSIKELDSFPMLSERKKDPLTILREMENSWLAVSRGNDWLAAGVGFELAGLFRGKAVLLAQLGEKLEFDVLGKGVLDLPKQGAKKYLHLGLNVEARLQPSEGVFSMEAVLRADSFLVYKDCHITGGLALYTWFGAHPRRGDFVVTAGGYHPSFAIPEHYPKAEPVGILWNISSQLTMNGSAYFALTPSCVMAGGNLAINYVNGNLRAWFYAFANLLIAWKPFHFLADIGVELGVSYRMNLLFCHKTISVSIGGNLHLWGPPTGGKVTVHLWFLSFTVAFGEPESEDTNRTPLTWDEFDSLLPETDILSTEPVDGLLEKEDDVWKVSGDTFRFSINSLIPSSSIRGSGVCKNRDGRGIQIRPMNLSDVASELSVKIEKTGADGTENLIHHFNMNQREESMSAALWGTPQAENGKFVQNTAKPSAELTEKQLSGAELSIGEGEWGGTLFIPDLEGISIINKNDKNTVSLTLVDYRLPRLKSGRYTITLEQSLSHNGTSIGAIPSKQQEFIVGSIPARLPETLVAGCYPPAGSSGAFSNALPHLTLAGGTLPWEQEYGADKRTPCLALLLFTEKELSELEAEKENGQTLCLTKEQYEKRIPTEEELRLLCHGRRNGDSGEDFSVIMANRFPQKGKNTAHLVLLANKKEKTEKDGTIVVELPSLYRFDFSCHLSEAEDFYQAAVRLKRANPKLKEFGSDVSADGCVKLCYHNEQKDVLCYRGPLVLRNSNDTADKKILETARQIGRMAALTDSAYLHAMMSYRRKGTEPVLQKTSVKDTIKTLERRDGFFIKPVSKELWQERCTGVYRRQPENTNSKEKRRKPENQPFYDRKIWNRIVKQEREEIEKWLLRLMTLEFLPFGYLAPIKELIPNECVRGFRLDKNWLKSLIGGALEPGETCSRQKLLTQLLKEEWENRIDESDIQGVLIRSDLFENWGNSQIILADKNGAELKILRRDMMSGNICLLLCEGEVAAVRIREPAEGIRMQINEDMSVSPRYPATLESCHKTCRENDGWKWYRDEEKKILNICGEKGFSELFQSVTGTAMTPSGFALQFLEGARSV